MNWWENFFDQDYARRFLPAEVENEASQLLGLLQLQSGSRVFDQCCGQGRFSQALARRGLTPVGVDFCSDYIQAARRECPQGEFHCQDAGTFVSEPVCDGGFNVYSSFGYSERDQDNARLLRAAHASLRPGARLVLDTINFANVVANFRPSLIRDFEDGLVVERLSQIDWERGLLQQRWFFRKQGEPERQHFTQTRMFMPRDLAELLRAAGFEPLDLLSGLDGAPFERDRPRLVWVARRL
ncbi:class I SAM-dependent methyltransferase [bacterium]|nr:class I SAM-dependent methyltransferase [bacterium]